MQPTFLMRQFPGLDVFGILSVVKTKSLCRACAFIELWLLEAYMLVPKPESEGPKS